MNPASPGPASSSSRRWVAWGLVGVGLLVLLWLFLKPDSPPPHKRLSKIDDTESAVPDDESAVARPARPSPGPSPQTTRSHQDEKRRERLDRMKAKRLAMIEDALDAMRFPPDSQPLSMDMIDLIHPYHRSEVPKPLFPPKPGDDFDPETAPYFLLTGPSFAVGPGEPLVATLEVFKGRPAQGKEPHRMPIEQIRARLLRFAQPHYEPVVEVDMNDEGHDGDQQPGDRIYTVAVTPSSVSGLAGYNGIVRLEVIFMAFGVGKPMRAALQYTITTEAPAVFTDVRREKLTPEGLQISMGLKVTKPGYYFVQGLLFDADGKPIGFAVHRDNYDKGLQEVPLTFFGLLFHQAKAKSPYVFKTVTGSRLPSGQEPSKIEIPPWKGSYTTRHYELSDFSEAEWQSEQKDRRLKALQELADTNPEKKPVVQAPDNPHGASSSPPSNPLPAKSK